MRLLTFLSVLLPWASWTCAQSPVQALAEAERRFSSLKTYAATWEYSMRGHTDTGHVYYKGPRYRFEYPSDLTIFDGNIALNWNREFARVTVEIPPFIGDFTFGGIYQLHADTLSHEFHWTDSSATSRTMSIFSFSDESPLIEARITINRSTKLIEAYSLEFDRFKMDYRVLTTTLNKPLKKHLFEIDWDLIRKIKTGEIPPEEHHH